MRPILLAVALTAIPLLADSFGTAFPGYSITPVFQNKVDSPGLPFIPLSYGGLSARPGEPNQLIIGGTAEGSGAAFYSVGLTRDVGSHIAGLSGVKSLHATAPKLAGGAAFGPSFNAGEVFFYTIGSGSGGVDVGMIRWGHNAPDKTAGIVPETPGGLGFVPPGFGGFQRMKVLSSSGKFYSVTLQADAEGTYDLAGAELTATLPVANVQSFVYVKAGSPGFAADSLLVAEHAAGSIAAYEIDAHGNPRPATRRVFFSGPPFSRPEGMMIDPVTGDLLVSTFSSSTSGIYRISGFTLAAPIPVTGCQSITTPGQYRLTQDIGPATGIPCIQIRDTSNVHLSCAAHSVTGYITVANTNDFSIRDCVLPSNPLPGNSNYLVVSNSRNGLISHNTIGTIRNHPYYVRTSSSQQLNIVDNQIYAYLNMQGTATTAVRFNRVANPFSQGPGQQINSEDGANNVFDANFIHGEILAGEGDLIGIELRQETGDIVSNNDIICASYCSLLVDISGAKVNANRTRGGSWAWSGTRVTDVVWSNNVVESPFNRSFLLEQALRNKLERNTASGPGAQASIRSVVTPAGQNFIRENVFGHTAENPLRGNPDFGTLPVPAGAIIDGGGNICLAAPGPYPLACK